MSDAREAIRAKLRTRVRVTLEGGEALEGVLAAFSPADVLFVADPRGIERKVPLADVAAVDDARYTCSECGKQSNTTYDGDRCADCYRVWAAHDDAPQEICEEADCATRAFYSPGAKKFRCAFHHAQFNTLSGQGVEARVLEASVAECRSDDVNSLRHDWKKVKSQWLCKRCKIKHFGSTPAGALH